MKKVIILIALMFFSYGCKKEFDQIKYAENQKTKMVVKTDLGTISIALFTHDAPKNTSNVIKLADKKFYDGTTFHRVIPNFVIQGGDPNSKDNDPNNDGYGGPGYTVTDEISSRLKFLKGTVGMANAGPNTNGSQFFICLSRVPHLDGKYTIIGQVIGGMDTVQKIAAVKTDKRDRPIKNVTMNSLDVTGK